MEESILYIRECLTGGFLPAVFHKSSVPYQFLLPETSGTASRYWGHRMRQAWISFSKHSPYHKLLSLNLLSWDMDCLLTFWPILIPCSLGNSCCTFGFLIFIIVERNFLYNSLYILTERSSKHLCSIRAWVPVSFFLFSLSLRLILWSVETHRAHSPARASKTPSRGHPVPLWAMQALCQGLYWFSA